MRVAATLTRTVRSVLAGVTALAALTLAPWVAAPAHAASTAPRSPACTTGHLQVQVTGTGRDNTDVYRFLQLTNTGPSCVLAGRASVSLRQHGHQLSAPGDYFPYSPNGRSPRTTPVHLAPHGHAAVWLALATAAGTACRHTQVDAFRLGLPTGGHLDAPISARQRPQYTVCASPGSHLLNFSQFLPASH